MFELIRANRRKSIVLILIMLGTLLAVGFIIGVLVYPETSHISVGNTLVLVPIGGAWGLVIAFTIWGTQALVAYASGDQLLMAAVGAKEIKKSDYPRLFNIVEEMKIAARLPAMPKIFVIPDMSLNAFAAGRDPNHSAVAVTQGLLAKLNRDQLQGVIAHEIAHIANRDVLFMTFAGIMLGSIIMITEGFVNVVWHLNRGTARRYSSRKNDNAEAILFLFLFVLAVALAVIAPLLAQLLYFACSRQREYLADAGGAVFTRYPEGLAQALEIIGLDAGSPETTSKVMAPMYIVNPLEAYKPSVNRFLSTHPPVEERIRILRSMAGTASYSSYLQAAQQTTGRSSVRIPSSVLELEKTSQEAQGQATLKAQPILPASTIGHTTVLPASPTTDSEPNPRVRYREAGDLVRKIHGFRFVFCSCGLKMKIPQEYTHKQVKCPRCSKLHLIA